MSDWLEHSVQVEVDVPISMAWNLWSDLEQMPRWMQWIESVQVLDDNPDLSRWTLATGNFHFNWLSRILRTEVNQIIQWESVDGLPNRGAIRFYDRGDSSIVRLSVAYAIPGIIGRLMDNLFLGKVVENSLQNSLNHFREYALNAQAQEGDN
jgi:uncharacterized membrane protein